MLWKERFRDLENAGGEVVYGDTDSFFVKGLPKNYVVDPAQFNIGFYKQLNLKGVKNYTTSPREDLVTEPSDKGG